MSRFFFDFRVGDVISPDEDGIELNNVETAHQEALSSLVDAIRDFATEGQIQQMFAVEVRDDLGPVLEITAILGSRILRKQ